MISDRILIDREKRREEVKKITANFDAVTIKANIPGTDKNIFESSLLVRYFTKILLSYPVNFIKMEETFDGYTSYFSTDNGEEIKEISEKIEETHPLGRFIDIDVTKKGEEKSLSRKVLRKCFLCGKEAFVCGRNKTHTTYELIKFIRDNTLSFFSNLIQDIIEESMLFELNEENKFGLVTKTSSGSHTDLNYNIMKNAIERIKVPLSKAFFIGLTCEKEKAIDKLIEIGLECEEEMYKATSFSNAYKGFIFMGGLILYAFAYSIKNNLNSTDIYNTIKEIAKAFPMPINTFGYKAYKSGFGGIRENAKNGFKIVEKTAKYLLDNCTLDALRFIVENLEDSVLLKRAGSIEKYEYYKNLIINSKGKEEEITKECIKNNISIGGSADVLISSYMINKLKETFYIKD